MTERQSQSDASGPRARAGNGGDIPLFPAADPLASGYRALPGVWDELLGPDGTVRPHWAALRETLRDMAEAEVRRRFDAAERHLRESGVVHRVYDDTGSGERPWPLSPVPLILEEAEWDALRAGVVQRAGLIERVLADLYGPGDLVRAGLVPAAVAAGSPDFLRPLTGSVPAGGRHLGIYAVDLGRGPDGRWWVLGDRTQAPSGLGYALENRASIAAAFPDLLRGMDVARVGPFAETLREGLAALRRGEDGRLCLLTPGPLNETYFEHAYLARRLGLLLVEGDDLTVRDDEVHIRSVGGLRRADVIWRRIDGDFADPLELNAASRLGVPGLARAARAGRVALVNALGSGAVEARAWMAFLPAIARHLMGADLALPNVATWWCGQPAERAEVEARFDAMVLAPAFGPVLPGVLDGGAKPATALGRAERDAVHAALARRAVDLVGQEPVTLSTMPMWDGAAMVPRPVVLRLFAVATPDGWQVLPGGFARLSAGLDVRAVSLQRGGASADVWVVGGGALQAVPPPPPPAVEVRRGRGALPSRAGDNLYWLGRALERIDMGLRIARAAASRGADPTAEETRALETLLDLVTGWGMLAPVTPRPPGDAAAHALLFGAAPAALPQQVAQAQATAAAIRDRLSPDAWRALGDLGTLLAPGMPPEMTGTRLTEALRIVAALSGLVQENMNRLTGWRFLEIGRRLERGLAMCRLARVLAAPDAPRASLDMLLELADSQLTYRVRYVALAERVPVLDLVLLDPENPRSVAFQAERIAEHLAALPGQGADTDAPEDARLAAGLTHTLGRVAAAEIGTETFSAVLQGLLDLSDAITLHYFHPAERVPPGEAGP
ncbi:circularly permuted type 2 ATP-grasp protein [Futiania mangrovi]|uniref:Circularly permuted type 2 ATP-grasp protein n=1 Tax=Futiania mangrovi TaxID=2959716 RepID=A0A9J6PDR2_9PROT|nr:circularly permuted type 2 ATP-grasp protein [Futiania mangrovii]MCP1336785.1 circularly permuted type 2 ATP-grasp protein [Futiania mangrovii]